MRPGKSAFFLLLTVFSAAVIACAATPSNPALPPFEARPGAALDAFVAFGPVPLSTDPLSDADNPVPPPPSDGGTTFTIFWKDTVPQAWYTAACDTRGALNVNETAGPGKISDCRSTGTQAANEKIAIYLAREILVRGQSALNIDSTGARRVWVNGLPADSRFPVPLRDGSNKVIIESQAPTSATAWMAGAAFSPARPLPAPIPAARSGQRILCEPAGAAWRYYPSARDPKTTSPLLLFLPPPGEAPDIFIATLAPLIEDVRAQGWAVAVPEMPASLPSHPGAITQKPTRKEVLEAVRSDALDRFAIDPLRLCLAARGSCAIEALETALESSGRYAGVALIEPPSGMLEEWTTAPLNTWWHPPAVRLETGRAKTALDALRARPLDPQPIHAVIFCSTASGVKAGWLKLTQAVNPLEESLLRAEISINNIVTIITRNVAQFELSLRNMPVLLPGKPLTLDINQNRQRVIGGQFPAAISLRQVTRDNVFYSWNIEDSSVAPEPEPYFNIARLQDSFPPWTTPRRAGLDQLAARAVRRAMNAEIAVLPAASIHAGQKAGAVNLMDLTRWADDAELTTVSINRRTLRLALEADFAGPRKYVTDGLDARVSNGVLDAPLPVATRTLTVADAQLPFGADMLNALESLTSQAVKTTETLSLTTPSLSSQGLGVFAWCALDGPDGDVTLAMRKDMLGEGWLSQRGRTAVKARTPLPGTGPRIGQNAPTLRKALQRYFEEEQRARAFPPDARLEPLKKPEVMKRRGDSKNNE